MVDVFSSQECLQGFEKVVAFVRARLQLCVVVLWILASVTGIFQSVVHKSSGVLYAILERRLGYRVQACFLFSCHVSELAEAFVLARGDESTRCVRQYEQRMPRFFWRVVVPPFVPFTLTSVYFIAREQTKIATD